ncbi:hypothetical protein ABKN59_010833 [Abortiporus biennis]
MPLSPNRKLGCEQNLSGEIANTVKFVVPRVFPQEIFDLIIDFCTLLPEEDIDDAGYYDKSWMIYRSPRWKTLHALSLTCRAFNFQSRSNLFPIIHIYRKPHTSRLYDILRDSPQLGSQTHTLRVFNQIDIDRGSDNPSIQYADKISVNNILHRASRIFPNLNTLEIYEIYLIFHPSFPVIGLSFGSVTRLELRFCVFQSFQDLRRFISSFLSLDWLDLDDVRCLSEGITGLSQHSFSRFPRSRVLRIAYLYLNMEADDLKNMLIWLSSTRTLHSLKDVSLSPFSETNRSEVCNFMRNASEVDGVSLRFLHFKHLVDQQSYLPWIHIQQLTIYCQFSDCDQLSSSLSSIQDTRNLSYLSLVFRWTGSSEKFPFPQVYSTNVDVYAPWHALDSVLNGEAFQKIREINVDITTIGKQKTITFVVSSLDIHRGQRPHYTANCEGQTNSFTS